MKTTNKIKMLVLISSLFAGTLAYAETTTSAPEKKPVSASEETTDENPSVLSFSIEGVYGNSTKRASRGGINMSGLDLRLNYGHNPTPSVRNELSLGLLVLGGSENIGRDEDLQSTNIGLMAGFRQYSNSIFFDGLKTYIGVRFGFAHVDYVLDTGRVSGWDIYANDSDLCAVYAGEVGLAFELDERWEIRGGYQYYGNTAGIGGGEMKINEQQYHLFQIGAAYRF